MEQLPVRKEDQTLAEELMKAIDATDAYFDSQKKEDMSDELLNVFIRLADDVLEARKLLLKVSNEKDTWYLECVAAIRKGVKPPTSSYYDRMTPEQKEARDKLVESRKQSHGLSAVKE